MVREGTDPSRHSSGPMVLLTARRNHLERINVEGLSRSRRARCRRSAGAHAGRDRRRSRAGDFDLVICVRRQIVSGLHGEIERLFGR